jgi:hypothetical protein
MSSAYQYKLNDCDVPAERRQQLEAFRAKRTAWVDWLDHDEHHAIWQTISSMVWNDVSFRTIAHLAIQNEKSPLSNPLVAEQIIQGHVARQILSIRRLVDRTKGVISLRRLITDIRNNFDLFTRENYVCYDGLPYDYEPVMQRQMQHKSGKGVVWGHTSGPEAWSTSEMAHEAFDRLAGKNAGDRARSDRLPKKLLARVEEWLDKSGADELADWSHEYLAHASTRERRELKEAQITNDKITVVIKNVARVTEALSADILHDRGGINSLMATAQFDKFEHLDRPVLFETQTEEASKIWHDLSTERDAWVAGVREALIA